MALRNPEHQSQLDDDDLDDPIDMLSKKNSHLKPGPSSATTTESLLNPITDLPTAEIQSVTPSSPDLDLLFGRFGQLCVSKPTAKPRRRKWPTSLTPTQQAVSPKLDLGISSTG